MEYQLIGKITGFKGLKGEMKVKALSGFMKERLQPGRKIFIEINNQYQAFVVESYHEKQKTPLLTLEGFNDINKMKKFNKTLIYMDADEEIMLEDNAYHEDELIGLKVYQKDEYKGEVIDIRNYPRDDYLVVETDKGNVLIPFRDEFIKSMDDESIEIVDLEGLF